VGTHFGVHTFETSAKTGDNVENAIACLVFQVLVPCLRVAEQI